MHHSLKFEKFGLTLEMIYW